MDHTIRPGAGQPPQDVELLRAVEKASEAIEAAADLALAHRSPGWTITRLRGAQRLCGRALRGLASPAASAALILAALLVGGCRDEAAGRPSPQAAAQATTAIAQSPPRGQYDRLAGLDSFRLQQVLLTAEVRSSDGASIRATLDGLVSLSEQAEGWRFGWGVHAPRKGVSTTGYLLGTVLHVTRGGERRMRVAVWIIDAHRLKAMPADDAAKIIAGGRGEAVFEALWRLPEP